MVKRSRARGVEQATAIVEAAQRLIAEKEGGFTTQELVKEAGIALQTFYRYFEGKDHLVLAVLEHIITESIQGYKAEAAGLDDPIARLRHYVTATITGLSSAGPDAKLPRFVTAEHWRLQSLYPVEVSNATRPFTELIRGELESAAEAGVIGGTVDTEYSAWLVTQLVMGVFHHYAFAGTDEPYDQLAAKVWAFCAGGLGLRAAAEPAAAAAPAGAAAPVGAAARPARRRLKRA